MQTVNKTGKAKVWHKIDVRDMTIIESGLTFKEASHCWGGHFQYCRNGYKLIPCAGKAHSNPHIDNCGLCAPRWGWIMVPKIPIEVRAAEAEHADFCPGAKGSNCNCGEVNS